MKPTDRMRRQDQAITDLFTGAVKPGRDDPVIADCFECLLPANPAYGRNGVSYCYACAPDDLRAPGRKATDEGHAL